MCHSVGVAGQLAGGVGLQVAVVAAELRAVVDAQQAAVGAEQSPENWF